MKKLFYILITIFLLSFVFSYSEYGAPTEFGNETTTTASIGGDYGILNLTGNATINYLTIENPAISCSTIGTNCFTVQVNGSVQTCVCVDDSILNVNSSLSLNTSDGYINDINQSQFNNNNGILEVVKSWWDGLYCQLIGCTMEGDINMGENDLFNVSNINATNGNFLGNITTDEYFYGQPIMGQLGSGIIYINDTTGLAELNVTCSGLTCSYNNFKVRLVNSTLDEKYCDIPAGSIELTDNQHNVGYIDNNCNIQKTSIQTYKDTSISPGGITDFMNVIAYNGQAENINGIGLEGKRIIKLRKLLLLSSGKHLSIIGGDFNFQLNTFPQFNITSGEYVYLMDVVPSTKQNTAINNIEIVYHTGVGTWGHDEQTGLNLTSCDTGSSIQSCSNKNLYRRHFIFLIGNNDSGIDETHLHQLLPLEGTTYSISQCLDTENYPLIYTLPEYYEYGAVMLYAYCGRGTDSSWISTNFIDMRTVKTGSATSVPEGIYVKVDGSEPLTNNWNYGSFDINGSGNITANKLEATTLNITGNAYIGDLTWNGNLDLGGNDLFNVLNVNATNGYFSGNVGIGTTSPSSLLNLNGSTGSLSNGLTFGNGSTGIYEQSTGQIRLVSPISAGSAIFSLFGNAGSKSVASFYGNGVVTMNPDGANIKIGTHGLSIKTGSYPSEALEVQGNAYITGNLGIGTASPSQKLEVNGSVNIADGEYYQYGGYDFIRLANGTDVYYANTLIGINTGNTTAYRQTAIGFQAGYLNTGDSQTAIGFQAGYSNTGDSQTAMGHFAGRSNIGVYQTTMGRNSGFSNTGDSQTAIGYQAGYSNTGTSQIAIGRNSGYLNTGDYQTVMGYNSGRSNTGIAQTAIGYQAGRSNTGDSQTALGYYSGYSNTGTYQIAIGYEAGYFNTGNRVIGIGYKATRDNNGSDVVAIGHQAGYLNTADNQFIVQQANVNAVPLIQGNFSSGNLGIGTTSPIAPLEVALNDSNNNLSIVATGGILADTYYEKSDIDVEEWEDHYSHPCYAGEVLVNNYSSPIYDNETIVGYEQYLQPILSTSCRTARDEKFTYDLNNSFSNKTNDSSAFDKANTMYDFVNNKTLQEVIDYVLEGGYISDEYLNFLGCDKNSYGYVECLSYRNSILSAMIVWKERQLQNMIEQRDSCVLNSDTLAEIKTCYQGLQ